MNIESILQQFPDGTTQEQVEKLLIEFNNDIANVLSECWKMSEQPKKEASKHEKKWENIRNICNSYEEEMNNFMNKKK